MTLEPHRAPQLVGERELSGLQWQVRKTDRYGVGQERPHRPRSRDRARIELVAQRRLREECGVRTAEPFVDAPVAPDGEEASHLELDGAALQVGGLEGDPQEHEGRVARLACRDHAPRPIHEDLHVGAVHHGPGHFERNVQ